MIVSSTQHKCTPEELSQYHLDLMGLQQQRQELIELMESGSAIRLLSEALSNIRIHGSSGQLRSVTLSAVARLENTRGRKRPIEGGSNWRLIWQAAADCFRVVLASVHDSHLSFERLSIFDSLQRCSLGLDELESAERPALMDLLRGVRSLAISISIGWREVLEIEAAERAEGTPQPTLNKIDRIVSLLELAPELEDLETHFYRARTPKDRELQIWNEQTMASIETDISLPRLTKLTLRGLAMTERSLIHLVQLTKPKDLNLIGIRLPEG